MIVDTMNDREVANEVLADFPNARRYGVNVLWKNARRKIIRGVASSLVFTYVSPKKNTWIINVRKANSKKHLDIYFGCLRIKAKGYGLMIPGLANVRRASLRATDVPSVIYLTPHFFSRVNERLRLGIVNPLDVVKWVCGRRFDGLVDTTPGLSGKNDRDTMNPIHLCSEFGVSMGYYNGDILVIRTFITYDMRNREQLTKFNFLKDHSHILIPLTLEEAFGL